MYLCKPTREALASWLALLDGWDEPVVQGLKIALAGFDLDNDQELEDIIWEYTRLFIGPYKLPCPPLESVYTSPKRLMMQEAHDAVQEAYAIIGLEVANDDVMLDHIGVELNFMAVLHSRMTTGAENEATYRDVAERFVTDHLRNWVPRFVADLVEATESPLYRELAGVTGRLIEDERLMEHVQQIMI